MKWKETLAGVKKAKKCCYCGRWTHEPMMLTIYGGGGKHGVGNIYNCIRVTDCLERMRETSDRKGTPKTRQYVVDLNSFRVVAVSRKEAIGEARRMLSGTNLVPVIERVELAD